MKASDEILSVWKKFDEFPMETFTKAWYYVKSGSKKQRELSLMKEHKDQYGITGNCFDLSIWLLDEFAKAGIDAYPIGEDHAAVIALDERGRRYLCDLGDQWLNPILIDKAEDFMTDKLSGFFPAAEIKVEPSGNDVKVTYYRQNGKSSAQIYQTAPIERTLFLAAAEQSQNIIKREPLLEKRIRLGEETAHWEFYNWKSFLSTNSGLYDDPDAESLEEWADRIHQKTAFDRAFLLETLMIYKKMRR
ncbi:hypothetical protein M4D55_05020 [Metabacillus idriensis]|uniref:Uncharacterized protein n=1 Tax=Metabacillus idriensis TaxID=324768 RepID=A0A6I2M411_9BACI|nr:hypothetical protein [Metabacillus idriensis]MCM3595145.1 hypothetical protein [Metabacillus idriensis]MRX52828.1 hypothetical protein [Metabacillus idriensis]OHR65456.1 hypothetical protein HMPREF3291_02455 [Bacillus sp. HMSC76G11]